MAKRTAPEVSPGGDPQGQAQAQGVTEPPVPPVTDAPTNAAPPVVAAADPVAPIRPRVHPALAVTARRAMRRGGYTWPAGVTAVEADELSRDEFAALDEDSNFKVDFV